MHIGCRIVLILTGIVGCWHGPVAAQRALKKAAPLPVNYPADSLQQVRDSLEVALLKTSATYQQVERLLDQLPPASRYLDLLPSVLPIDVPIRAFQISSPFGMRRHPLQGRIQLHAGVDVRAEPGLIVKATAAGLVRQVGHHPTLGVFVVVRHAFGFETAYGHLAGYCVQPGDTIHRHQEIGRVGQTGRVTGPHLHYVIKKNGSVIDPFFFCFLLRRRLWLYNEKSKPSGTDVPASSGVKGLSSRGE